MTTKRGETMKTMQTSRAKVAALVVAWTAEGGQRWATRVRGESGVEAMVDFLLSSPTPPVDVNVTLAVVVDADWPYDQPKKIS